VSREVIEAVIAEFTRAGCSARHEHGRVHGRVWFSRPAFDGQRFYVVPTSSSDWRATLNARSDVRRMPRDLGVIRDDDVTAPESAALILVAGRPVCTSLDIGRHFSRQHKDVLRAIDKVRAECGGEFDQRNFAPISYADNGRTYRAYQMTRDGFSLVVMGFTGEAATRWKVRYIEAFNAMEAELAAMLPAIPAPDISALRGDLDALTDIVLSLPSPRRNRVPWHIQAAAMKARREQRRARA
jgi:Rha family phage regulatory protein